MCPAASPASSLRRIRIATIDQGWRLKGLGCRVEGYEGGVELELGRWQARIRPCQLSLAALRHNDNVTDSKPAAPGWGAIRRRRPTGRSRPPARGLGPKRSAFGMAAGGKAAPGARTAAARAARRPGYAPEPNRTESLWSSLKAVELANLTASTLAEVIDQAHRGIQRVRGTPHLAYSFLRHAGLSVS
jgi:transposase